MPQHRPEIPKYLAKKHARQMLERRKRAEVYEKGLTDTFKGWAAGSFFPVDVAEGVTQGALTPPASYKAATLRPRGGGIPKTPEPVTNPEYKGTYEDMSKRMGVDPDSAAAIAGSTFSPDPFAKIHALAALGKLGAGKLASLGAGAAMFGGLKKVGKAENVAKPIFTSPGQKAATEISKETIPANKVRSQLEGRGVNKDEMEWTGFNEWIKNKKGDVKKAEIEEFFQQNQIQVQEVVKGGGEDAAELMSKRVKELEKEYNIKIDVDENPMTGDPDVDIRGTGTEGMSEQEFEDLRWQVHEELTLIQESAPQPKFSEWQLPGGENYRELVLMVPPKKVPWNKEDVIPMTTEEYLDQNPNGLLPHIADDWWHFNTPGGTEKYPKTNPKATDFLTDDDVPMPPKQEITQEQALEGVLTRQAAPKPRFTGGHFEENDVVAHIRFNERYGTKEIPYSVETKEKVEIIPSNDPYMERVERSERPFKVRIEGSDSHVKGFKTREEAETYVAQNNNPQEHTRKEKILFIEEIQSDWAHKGRKEGFRDDKAVAEFKAYSEEMAAKYGLNPKQNLSMYETMKSIPADEIAKYEELQKRVYRGTGSEGVPVAPFIEDIHQWTNLALKRMVRWGSDNGFDSIGWVTGKQSADRYKVSKQISKIEYNNNGVLLAYDKQGERVLTEFDVTPEKLADYIGKEPANKLLKQGAIPSTFFLPYSTVAGAEKTTYQTLEGLDLDIGGEYHKLIYDDVLLAQGKKIGKKYGAKVEMGNLDSTYGLEEIPGQSGVPPESIKHKLKESKVPIWTMRLTDKLKQAAKEGLPYYVALPPLVIGGAAQRTEAQRQQAKTDAKTILRSN